MMMTILTSFNNIFLYDSGKLYCKAKYSRTVKVGSRVGTVSNGYREVTVQGKRYKEHRVIYEMFHGTIPEGLYIDHIDRNPLNNNISNLRAVTHQQNHFNTGAKGYCYCKRRDNYQAYIHIGGKRIHLGNFKTTQEAREAYLKAKDKYHVI